MSDRHTDAQPRAGCATARGCQGLERGAPDGSRVRALSVALAIAFGIMVSELVGCYLSGGSLALLSDAGHTFSDLGSIGLALFAAWVARRPASAGKTYGYYRAEILAALANGAALLAMIFWLTVEAYRRFTQPENAPPLDGRLMILFATFSIGANGVCAWVLRSAIAHGSRSEDLNLRGAFLHVLGDMLASVATILAGLSVWKLGWLAADAVAAAVLSLLLLASAGGLVLRSVDVLLESAPKHVDVGALEAALGRVSGIHSVHDLHIWSITSGLHAMSCHVRIAKGCDPQRVLADTQELIRESFGIEHTTVQVEVEETEWGLVR